MFSIPISAAAQPSDDELLAAHVAGDPYAFEQLFRRYHRRLLRLARTRCPDDADDVLQEAMLAAHRYAGSFRHRAAVSSWLHRIVLNACVDRLRRDSAQRTVLLDSDDYGVADRTAEIDTAIVVRRALMCLPADQRMAVIAVDMQGYSVADAAELLGIPQGTVKSRRARARARLALVLARPSPEQPHAAAS